MAMFVTTAIVVGFGAAYLELQKRNRMSEQMAAWELQEWKENLLTEREKEFLGAAK